MSCKDSKQNTESPVAETAHEHETEEAHEHDDHNKGTVSVLALNNGEKWKSDDPTNVHAQKLVELAEEFKEKSVTKNLEMYRNYADMLQQELNGMIKDCKMDGPDHDALHLWLKPVLDGVKELKEADNEENAKKIETHLSENILKYNQFFN